MLPIVVPQFVAGNRVAALRAAIADPERFVVEPKVDGVRFVAFDVPILAGMDLRALPWSERRERLELLAQAFEVPLELSPIIEPSRALAVDISDGRLEGIVLKDRTSPYRDGTRAGWWKVKDPRWFERECWMFDRRRI